MNENTQKLKSFWERDEGTVGMGILALGGLGIYFALPAILAFLSMAILVVGKTIVLAALCAVLGTIVALAMNNRFRTLISFLFKSSVRKLTSVFINIDPISIMKSYIETLYEKKASFDKNKSALRGQINSCQTQIERNVNQIKEAERLARAAQDAGNRGQLSVHGRNMTRLSEVNSRMSDMLAKMKMLYEFLNKYSNATDLVIQDMTNDVKAREMERQYSTTANSAMKSAMAILKGDGTGKEIYDEAMEFALSDYANKMGEIDDFMDSTQSIIEGIDIKNGMWEQAALEKLNEFENRTDSLLLGGEKRLMLENTSSQINFQNLNTSNTDKYSELFINR